MTVSAAIIVALTSFMLVGLESISAPTGLATIEQNRPDNPCKLVSAVKFQTLTNKLKCTDGFVGGDAAYSIKLTPNKSLWIFGDSFIGKIIDRKRFDCTMVRNAIAIDDRSKTKSTTDGRTDSKTGTKPSFYAPLPAFFKAPSGNFYWPGDGVMLSGKLYLFMHETENAPKKQPPFQFNPLTDHLLIVQNPLAEPTQWEVKDFRIGNRSSKRLIGIACVLDGDYLYVYCANSAIGFGPNKQPTALARIKSSDLQAGQIDKLEWLGDGWQKEGNFLDTLWEDGATEMTVTRLPGLSGYFAFYLVPFGTNEVLMRHADHPEGPWSKSIVVYKLPEIPSSKSPKTAHDIFFYSAKAHPEYCSAPGEVALTYCSNSSVFSRVLNDARLYFPEAAKIKLARTN